MIKLRKIHISTETPLILIEGEVKAVSDDDLIVDSHGECAQWPLLDNKFRAFCHLKKRVNTINLSIGGNSTRMTAMFNPSKKIGTVEVLYVTCEDERNEENLNQTIKPCKDKVALLALLTQYFYANTTSRKSTFSLRLNSHNLPIVHELILKKSLNELIQMSQNDIWQYVAEELLSSPLYSSDSKFFAVTSFNSSFSEESKIALAAGGLSLIGSYILDDFPCKKASDLSYWFNQSNSLTISNCIGSCIHEIGHMFDLGHSIQGVMSGDLSSVGSFFLEGKKNRFWSPSSLEILSCHKWLNKHILPISDSSEAPFTYTNGTIKSQNGISVIEWRDPLNGLVLNHTVFTLPAKLLRLTQGQSDQEISNESSSPCQKKTVVLMDMFGNLFKTSISQ